MAARKLHSHSVAIVFGKTIHLWKVDAEDFLADEKWLRHELCHIRQYRKYGKVNFVYKYLLESARKGYYGNKYEAEAREAEEKNQP